MFFGSKKRREPQAGGTLAAHDEHASDRSARARAERLRAWRESAETVTVAWQACVAAEGRERDSLYISYLAALEDEQRAATELARASQLSKRELLVEIDR